MPTIFLEIGSLTKDQKRAISEGFTKVAVEVTKIPAESFVVYVRENSLDNIAIGGKLISDRK